MSLYRHTRGLLHDAGLRPRKQLGQSFLVDARVLDAITEAAELSSDDLVLEIGAGTGTLTQRLAVSSDRVIAVELDAGLFSILQSIHQDMPNVTLIHADILGLDFSALIGVTHASPAQTGRSIDQGAKSKERESQVPSGSYPMLHALSPMPAPLRGHLRIKVIGNLPYYITTPILMKILDESSLLPIQMALVMVQEEVGARMVASPGTKDYGALSIAIAYRSDAEILEHVPADSFYPQPKVDSVLVKLNIRSAPSVNVKDEKLFFRIVRAAFQYRRKTLRNALRLAGRSGGAQLSIDSIDSALQALNFDPRRRGETLSCAEFADLANTMTDDIK
jgi:16S rRNA (adenine1518-N6/adenine1519-N6)-dimethyltransferase